MSKSFDALNSYLEPLEQYFQREGVTEIMINKPNEIWVEQFGKSSYYQIPILDFEYLRGMASLIAQSTEQIITEEHPILSATLPNGYRIQIVIPPACEIGSICFSIRKPSQLYWSLEDYESMKCFEKTSSNALKSETDEELSIFLQNNQIKEFLRKAVIYKKNIIISGGTSTGKTTFTNSLLMEIPPEERLITAEDAREIILSRHKNKLHLLASKGGQGRADVSTQELIEACLRLRPDRIIVGELRGSEAFSFLRAINTGHPGSISTLHADSPFGAINQLKLMVMQAGLGISSSEIEEYIRNVVDIIVQLKRKEAGTRYVSEIYFKGSKNY